MLNASGMILHHQQVKRTVFPFLAEQALKPQQTGKQRTNPQDGRGNARDGVKVRAYAEGKNRDNRQKEQYARQRTASGTHCQSQFAFEQRRHEPRFRCIVEKFVPLMKRVKPFHFQ